MTERLFINTIKATPWQVTPADWATGFDIKIETDEEWEVHLSCIAKKRDHLFTDEDRKKMHKIRDDLVNKINT